MDSLPAVGPAGKSDVRDTTTNGSILQPWVGTFRFVLGASEIIGRYRVE
jgi:hypothetical protein